MGFQENLRYYRERAGYKQAKDFVKALGISYTTYTSYENQGREPKYNTLKKIADLLDVSLDELLGRKNNILGKNDDDELFTLIDTCIKSGGLFENLSDSLNSQPKIELKNIDDKYINFELVMVIPNEKDKIVTVSVEKENFVKEINKFNKNEELNKRSRLKRLTIYETIKSAELTLKGYSSFTWNEITKEQNKSPLKNNEYLIKTLNLLKAISKEQERLAIAKENFLNSK